MKVLMTEISPFVLSATNKNAINVKTLGRCFDERIDREMSIIVDTVEGRIQNAILIAIDSIVAPKSELAIRSINGSCGQGATSDTATSERGEHVGINASFENASGNNKVAHAANLIDENRNDIPDEVSEFSVSETGFDRQTHTHHSCCFFSHKICIQLTPTMIFRHSLSH